MPRVDLSFDQCTMRYRFTGDFSEADMKRLRDSEFGYLSQMADPESPFDTMGVIAAVFVTAFDHECATGKSPSTSR